MELPQATTDNVLIVFENALLARNGTTVTATSFATKMGAELLTTELRGDWWRSGTVAGASGNEISVTFTLGESTAIDWFSYHWSNNLLPWAVELYNGSPSGGGTLLATSDWVTPVVKSSPADWAYGDFPWTLSPSNKRIAEMAADYRLASFWHFPATVYGVTHVKWRFDCASNINGIVDYIQASLPIAGVAWTPRINMVLGANLSPVSRSIVNSTADGTALGLARRTGMRMSFDLEHVSDDEGMTDLLTNWAVRQGELARVFAYLEPAARKRRLFYDGGAFIGVLESFDGVVIDEHEGDMDGEIIAKSARGINVLETG